jgi:hypothetical protein
LVTQLGFCTERLPQERGKCIEAVLAMHRDRHDMAIGTTYVCIYVIWVRKPHTVKIQNMMLHGLNK